MSAAPPNITLTAADKIRIAGEQRELNYAAIKKSAIENPAKADPGFAKAVRKIGAAGKVRVNGDDRPEHTAALANPVTVADFFAYMPEHRYVFVPSRELWPGASVNARCAPPTHADGRVATIKVRCEDKNGAVHFKDVPMKPTKWLDEQAAVDQMTWAPGEPLIIRDRLVSQGGWIHRPGCACFNLYRPPQVTPGDANVAYIWIEHIERVYPEAVDHILKWLAHRVQRPQDKINHALVLGGAQGIGKDTILEPVKYAVGPWNFAEVSPTHMLGSFNGYTKSVILRVSEARDLGDVDRYAFYDHMKVYTAAPPDVLRCNEKNIREYSVMNVCGVIITSNHKTDGIYLPADDRRHYVAWSDRSKESFGVDYWNKLYAWYADGGLQNVAAYLAALDLTGFDPKAPPPHTAAFWDIVDASRAPEDAEIADLLDRLGTPKAITLRDLTELASEEFRDWLQDRRNRRQIPHRLEAAGYTPVRNSFAVDGLWKIEGKRQAIYADRDLNPRDQLAAATSRSRDRL